MNENTLLYSRNAIGLAIMLTTAALMLPTLGLGDGGVGAVSFGDPPEYDLTWHTVDGGGVMLSTGGGFELSGTIGQPDAGEMAGDDFTLTGGFWFALAAGDCNTDGGINLFDYDAFKACLSGPAGGPLSPGCVCFDLNGDGTVDLLDFAELQSGFSGS